MKTARTGLPTARYVPAGAEPLGRILPIVIMLLGAAYVIACMIEVLIIDNQVNWVNSLFADDSAGAAQPADGFQPVTVASSGFQHVALIASGVFIAAMIAVIIWQRRLRLQLGSVGARRAVFRRAGYPYFRGAVVASLLLTFFLNRQTSLEYTSFQDAVSHLHLLMVYYGLRALIGVAIVFFAYRLMRMSSEGIHRLLQQAV